MAKFSPLAEIHSELDAKMAPYHNWSMPVNYPGGIQAEHRHARKYCSIFDGSSSGKIRIAGNGSAAALDKIFMYPVSASEPGKCIDNFLLSDSGCFIDRITLLKMAEDDCFAIASTENTAKVLARLQELLPDGTEIQDLTEQIAQIQLYGPAAADVLVEAGADAEDLPLPQQCGMLEIAGIRCIASRMENAGESGFEFFCSAENAIDLWDELTCIEPVRPAGTGTRESLRIEKGIPGTGTEYTSDITPLDCGIRIPEREFAGSAALKAEPCSKIAAVRLDTRQTAKAGDSVFSADTSEEIGKVTSASLAPNLDCACAFCRVKYDCRIVVGDKLILKNGNTELTGIVSAVYAK